MKWISVEDRLPDPEEPPYQYVIKHYNDVREIAKFDGEDWWVISPRFSMTDEKIPKEYWPDYWLLEE